jgi:hypothetical protein
LPDDFLADLPGIEEEGVLHNVDPRAPSTAGAEGSERSGMDEGLELGKVARHDGQRLYCAIWLHKAREMPKDDFRREVEKELTGREEEPSELIYFKVYKGSTHWKQELVPIRRTRELQFCAIIAKFIILTRGILRLFNRNSGKYLSERITLFLPSRWVH